MNILSNSVATPEDSQKCCRFLFGRYRGHKVSWENHSRCASTRFPWCKHPWKFHHVIREKIKLIHSLLTTVNCAGNGSNNTYLGEVVGWFAMRFRLVFILLQQTFVDRRYSRQCFNTSVTWFLTDVLLILLLFTSLRNRLPQHNHPNRRTSMRAYGLRKLNISYTICCKHLRLHH